MYKYVIQHGSYYLVDEEEEIHSMSDEVAICFSEDGDMFTLLKHGSPELVEKWADETRKSYIKAGLTDIARDITVISGKIAVEELNKIISITGYIKRFLTKIEFPVQAESKRRSGKDKKSLGITPSQRFFSLKEGS